MFNSKKTINMKKTSLAIIFACFAFALVAQDGAIKVNYKGSKPTISDFAWAFLTDATSDDDGCINEPANAVKQAWIKQNKGRKLDKGETLTIDKKNGYVLYESKYGADMLRIEMCYWNEADGKHKLFAYNVASFRNGKFEPGQFDSLTFYRYNNATKKMTMYNNAIDAGKVYGEDDTCLYFNLPRTGKNITVNYMNYNTKNIKKKILKWNGHKFAF